MLMLSGGGGGGGGGGGPLSLLIRGCDIVIAGVYRRVFRTAASGERSADRL